MYSTTRGWNPGDEFILFGVRALVDAVVPGHNAIIYNRNPELHATRVLFPRIEVRRDRHRAVPVNLTEALKDVVWRYDNSWRMGGTLKAVDYCIFAGTPEWFGPMTAPLVEALNASPIPVAYLGVGSFEGRGDLCFADLPEPDQTLLRRAALVSARDSACARLLAPVGAEHLPCPALFSAPHQRQREATARPRIALNTQGFAVGNPQRLGEPAASFVRTLFQRLAERFDCTLVCHFADEAQELSDWLPGVEVRYSYEARDYLELYADFDLTVTTRVHGAGLCASLGIPAVVIAHSARSETVAGFLSEQIDVTHTSVEQALGIIDALPIAQRSQAIIDHKAQACATYVQRLSAFFSSRPVPDKHRTNTATTPAPAAAQALFDAAFQAHRQGRENIAVEGYRKALAVDAEHPGALHCLGLIAHARGDGESAVGNLRRAVKAAPGNATYWSNLGLALSKNDDLGPAIDAYEQALSIAPRMREAHSNLASALLAHGEFARASLALRESLERWPEDHNARNSLAMALHREGQLDAAIDCYRDVIARAPEAAEAHANLGFALLAAGRYSEGWPEYAWRRRLRAFRESERDLSAPLWDGGDIRGQTLLVHCEQGLGDTLMFARLVPQLVDRGARVLFEVQPALVRLLGSLHEGVEVFATGAPHDAFDVHCPLPDLAARLGITLDHLPGLTPYLHAGKSDVTTLQARIGASDKLSVALVWAGSSEFTGEALRSPGFESFAPLLDLPHCRFISLQRDPGHQQLVGHPRAAEVLDLYTDLTDMAMTAAAVQCVDVIVTSCTAPLHLAGALGRPVLAALPYAPDWRWLLNRDDSPWYPGIKLFRQSQPRQWSDVVERIAVHLQGLSG